MPGQQPSAQNDHSEFTGDVLLLDITPSIVEPLLVVTTDLAIDTFLPQFQCQPHACYALANADGCFLGLLDSSRLLYFLTTQSTLLSAPVTPTPETAPPPFCLLPAAPLLHELLEHLPLPVMLQTRNGQVLTQNSIWRSQISELLDPTCLRQEVATLLEMPLAEPSMVGAQSTARRLWSSPESSTSPSQDDAWLSGSHPSHLGSKAHAKIGNVEIPPTVDNLLEDNLRALSPLEGSSCQLGSKPGTCICVCPLKDGQEQILQFVRIPLTKLTSQAALELGDRTQTVATAVKTQFIQESASPSQLFRLAALLSTLHDNRPTAQASQNFYQVASERSEHDRSLGSHLAESAPDDPALASDELWLILAQDVTEQQQLARELTAKNADLVQLNRLKDEFLACISHELRTPLTAVLGLSSLLKDQTLGALNQRQVHYAQLIYQSGRHLMAVVNDILDLTRIETGQLELVLEPVDLETVCQRAFAQARQQQLQESQPESESQPHQPTFSLTLEPGLGLLLADEQRLRQMLVHLISNALKFTEPNDPIGLKVGYWGGWIAFTVWDTGAGIPAEKQHLIFQKFQQLENPLTRRFEGTGLGLVLTQRLARLHGGDVTFISKEGEGSQFTILLPPKLPEAQGTSKGCAEMLSHVDTVRSEAARTTQSRSQPSISSGTPTLSGSGYALDVSASQRSQLVLIVEAVPQGVELLSDELTGLGYRVVIARSGTEALEKARRLQPCIIFLNPVLPLLSGWDVLTLLKSSLDTQQIPVVMMATKVDEEQAQQRQADHLLSLPIQPKRLQKCLQQLVVDRQNAAHSPRSAILTVLRLSPGVWASPHQPIPSTALDALLHSCQHRILEADDLEQAELLARVWKPNVVLLDGVLADATSYFRLYCQHIFLASLPLVTIDQATSQAANQAKGLLVFPCLSASSALPTIEPKMEIATLLQVIQIAAGYAWRPLVLALDALTLPMSLETPTSPDAATRFLDSFPMETEWLQALIQYLHTADLRGSIGRCWQEVFQQLESHSVDVLLLCWTDAIAQSFTIPMLISLQSLHKRPPILVLDHRQHYRTSDTEPIAPLPDALQQIATNILPAPLPMTELLHQIHLAMNVSKR
jgi:signal transduction histidine kinase/DNA-binding NarL/FixJ family response regulator